MTCANCHHWRLQLPKGVDPEKRLAKAGFGSCASGPAHRFTSALHRCDRHKPAPADVTAKRVAWLKAMGLDIDKEK